MCWSEEQRHRGVVPKLSAELSHVRSYVGKLFLASLSVDVLTTELTSLMRSYSEILDFNFKHHLTLNSLPRWLNPSCPKTMGVPLSWGLGRSLGRFQGQGRHTSESGTQPGKLPRVRQRLCILPLSACFFPRKSLSAA